MKAIYYKRNDLLKRLHLHGFESYPKIDASVRKIVQDIQDHGDRALLRYSNGTKNISFPKTRLTVSKMELKKANLDCDLSLKLEMREMIRNTRYFHEREKENSWFIRHEEDILLGQIFRPIEQVGFILDTEFIPSISDLIEMITPAIVAGVKKINVALSGDPGSGMYRTILAVLCELKITNVYRIGGASAVAAFAFGTRTVPSVEKIVGKGNVDVRLAKYLVSGWIDTDSFIQSETIAILADHSANVQHLVDGLMKRTQRKAGSQIILITDSKRLIERIKNHIIRRSQMERLIRTHDQALRDKIKMVLAKNLLEGIQAINQIGPREVQVLTKDPWNLVSRINRAKSIYVGEDPVTDPIAPGRDIRPFGLEIGKGRFSSGLGWRDFVRTTNVIWNRG